MALNPYLYFDGQCEEAFRFYEECLGPKITFMMTWDGSPSASQAPPGWAKKVLHAGLASGDGILARRLRSKRPRHFRSEPCLRHHVFHGSGETRHLQSH
jgi:uncharacterized glyoxalase superfamily protein PhnB